MALLIMADQQVKVNVGSKNTSTTHNNNTKNLSISNIKGKATSTSQQEKEVVAKMAMFHDFLGTKATDSPVVLGHENVHASPSASASLGGASSGGGRPPLSNTSDLASSERQQGNHLEGIPFYGPRGDISALEISNRLVGSKRSNSDSAFTASTRDGILRMAHDSLESLHLMKMLKNGARGERSRRSNDDESFYSMQSMRPASGTLILHPSAGSRHDTTTSRWERSNPLGASMQHAPHGSQFVPITHQVAANRIKDTNSGPPIISQAAADEGSRTGIKGPGILSSINATEKNPCGMPPSGSKTRSGTHTAEPESSTPSSQPGLASASRQMTVFYGGQAHVFDDVHPNKADVIMALAGSNGGSWSTTYSPKPTLMPTSDGHTQSSSEHEARVAANTQFQRELPGRLSIVSNASHGIGPGDRISTPTGGN